MTQFNRVMAGAKSRFAKDCVREGFIGIDYGLNLDLTNRLPEKWAEFNREFRPIYLAAHPNKTKIAAGLACGMIHTLSKGLHEGDVILTPDGQGNYHIGRISGPYFHVPDGPLQHRRPVVWSNNLVARSDMSLALQRSTNSTGTCCDVTKHGEELERLIGGRATPVLVATDETIEDPTVFALEKHLEDFLVANWGATELGRRYDIYEEDSELVGQQYPSDTGPIDILAISKDKRSLLVVELKRGRASDSVVGQIQRYMGYVRAELAEPDQEVEGVIIALDDDLRIRRALGVTSGISFYRYEVSFKLSKA